MKILFILLLTLQFLFAFELHRQYSASVGLYGDIGQGFVKETHDKNKYIIQFTAQPTTFISDLSGINFIQYKSVGAINEKGVFIPKSFISIISKDDKKEKTTYIYNHLQKYIVKKTHIEEEVEDATIDSLIFGGKKRKHTQITNTTKKIPYVQNDYLTLIRNVNFLQEGEIQYLDQNTTNSLNLLSSNKNLFKIKIKTKDKKYLLELQNDIYGLVKAKTLQSLAIGEVVFNNLCQHQVIPKIVS